MYLITVIKEVVSPLVHPTVVTEHICPVLRLTIELNNCLIKTCAESDIGPEVFLLVRSIGPCLGPNRSFGPERPNNLFFTLTCPLVKCTKKKPVQTNLNDELTLSKV